MDTRVLLLDVHMRHTQPRRPHNLSSPLRNVVVLCVYATQTCQDEKQRTKANQGRQT